MLFSVGIPSVWSVSTIWKSLIRTAHCVVSRSAAHHKVTLMCSSSTWCRSTSRRNSNCESDTRCMKAPMVCDWYKYIFHLPYNHFSPCLGLYRAGGEIHTHSFAHTDAHAHKYIFHYHIGNAFILNRKLFVTRTHGNILKFFKFF